VTLNVQDPPPMHAQAAQYNQAVMYIQMKTLNGQDVATIKL
jgi:hypothetical protein